MLNHPVYMYMSYTQVSRGFLGSAGVQIMMMSLSSFVIDIYVYYVIYTAGDEDGFIQEEDSRRDRVHRDMTDPRW